MDFDLSNAILGIAALLFVVALFALSAWAFKAFFGSSDNDAGKKGREKRLGVVETAQVDANRRLCLVRRDDVEPARHHRRGRARHDERARRPGPSGSRGADELCR